MKKEVATGPPLLTIVPAGAGSGKTHELQTTLAGWVSQGLVQPDRIVAVTFTKAAAGELRERIRSQLIHDGRLDDALKLDDAYISTIHSFGLRLIQEFAFDKGLNPLLRQLEEREQELLVRKAVAGSDKADQIIGKLAHFGYKRDPMHFDDPKTAEEKLASTLDRTIAKLRSIGCDKPDAAMLQDSAIRIRATYGKVGDEARLNQSLHSAVTDLLAKYPRSLEGLYPTNRSATTAFKKSFRNLKQAKKLDNIETDWGLWLELQKLRQSMRGTPTPDGYDDLAQAVMEAAAAISHHPGPLRDAIRHSDAILGVAQEGLAHYADAKRSAGLLDYMDMLALADALLDRPDIMAEFRSRIDCLVIDEFQDTNPLQFAMLWKIKEAGVPTMVVGDLKQAIMSVQDADHRLLDQLQQQYRGQTRPLTCNWRTTSELMAWINQMGKGLFGDAYQELEPKAPFQSKLKPLELLCTDAAYADKGRFLAARIGQLLEEEPRVYDKFKGDYRPLRGGDIAILCPTRSMIKDHYGPALNQAGVLTRVEEPGWYDSRVIQLALHALEYVADPADRHAALYLAVTELGGHSLQGALDVLIAGESLQESGLDNLHRVGTEAFVLTVPEVVDRVIEVLDLFSVTACWPDGPQARANLLRLRAEAEAFVDTAPETLAAQGVFGSGLFSFLAWLDLAADQDDNQPQVNTVDDDAVVLSTWHSAKGKEWPVVVVMGTWKEWPARLPSVEVEFQSLASLASVLDEATVQFHPSFASDEVADRFKEKLRDKSLAESRRLLYVALTRAREKLILLWPTAPKPQSFAELLSSGACSSVKDDKCIMNGIEFDAVVHKLAKRKRGEEVPEVEPVVNGESVFNGTQRSRMTLQDAPEDLTPDHVTPSSHPEVELPAAATLEHQTYAAPLDVEVDLRADIRGTVLHRCFEIFSTNPASAGRVNDAVGYDFEDDELRRLATHVDAFGAWLTTQLQPTALHREMPVIALDENGTVVEGIIDLLVETRDGYWVIDHKSDRIDDTNERFAYYFGQLDLYRKGINSLATKPVCGLAINWVSRGEVTLLRNYSLARPYRPEV